MQEWTLASRSWMRVLLSAGPILAIALLAQTIVGYRYVSQNLIDQAGRRSVIDRVRSVEQAIRLAHPEDAAAVERLLDELRQPGPEVASIELISADGTVLASSGGPVRPGSDVSAQVPGRAGEVGPLIPGRRADRDVLIGTWPCRCRVPRQSLPGAPESDPARWSFGLRSTGTRCRPRLPASDATPWSVRQPPSPCSSRWPCQSSR